MTLREGGLPGLVDTPAWNAIVHAGVYLYLPRPIKRKEEGNGDAYSGMTR